MAKANGHEILPDIEMPKQKRTQSKPKTRKYVPRKTLEKDFEKQLIWYLNLPQNDCVCKKIDPIDATYNQKYLFFGISDLICFSRKKKKVYFIECKSPKGKLSSRQVEFKKLCEDCGVPYIVARTIEDVNEVVT